MKFSNKLFIVFLTITIFHSMSILHGHPTSAPDSSYEITLEDDLFAALTSKKPTVIMGYMEYCPHCKSLKPFFDSLRTKYKSVDFLTVHGPKLSLHKKVAEISDNNFKIPGFPSIVLVKNGKIKALHIGGNTKSLDDAIKKFLKDF